MMVERRHWCNCSVCFARCDNNGGISQASLWSEICGYGLRYVICCCCALCNPQFNTTPPCPPFCSLPLLFCPWLILQNTPQRCVFDILTTTFPGVVSYCRYVPWRVRRLRLCSANKSSYFFFCNNGSRSTLICCRSMLRALGRPTARILGAVCSSKQGTDGTGISTEDTRSQPTSTHPSTHSTGGKKPLECIF